MPARTIAILGALLAATLWAAGLSRSPASVQAETAACAEPGLIFEADRIDAPDLGLVHPAGMAYVSQQETFILIEDAQNVHLASAESRMAAFNRFGDVSRITNTPASRLDSPNTAYDPRARAVYVMDLSSRYLLPIPADLASLGFSQPRISQPVDLRALDLSDPRGIAFDPFRPVLFILDPGAGALIEIHADHRGSFAARAAALEGRAFRHYLGGLAGLDLRGLAFHPRTRELFTLDPDQGAIHILDRRGNLLETCYIDDIFLRDPRGLVFAPSGDSTDHRDNQSLYITDSGIGLDIILPGQFIELNLAEIHNIPH